jgi:hypothetical protein
MDPLPTAAPSPELPPHEVSSEDSLPAHTAGQVFAPGGEVTQPIITTPMPAVEAITVPATAMPTVAPMPMPDEQVIPSQPIVGIENYTVSPPIVGNNEAGVINSPMPHQRRRFSLKSPLVVAILAVLIVLGGSAAAYFGYVIPNKPENVLAKAVSNSLAQTQLTTTGTLDSSSDGIAAHMEYTADINETTHALDLKLNVTISGVKIPLEIITINKNLYFKVGDLSSLEGILAQFAGVNNSDYKNLEDQVNKAITNQWIEVDSTLIKEAKLDCLANYPTAFSQTDINALKTSYKGSPFVTISSHSADKVNGAAATKYLLSINDDSLAKLNLNNTGYFKTLNDCLKQADPSSSLSLSSLKDGDKTPLTIWVDKANKRIVKYEFQSTAKDKSKGVDGDLSGTISYGNVNITQPTNAKPVLNLLNDLNLDSIFSNSLNSKAADTERKTDINALHSQLEAYDAENGYYPTLASLNDPAWRAANMKGLDSEALKDPSGTTAKLAASPAKGVYAYAVKPLACDNGTHGNCTGYTLTATLDDGTTYAKQDLNSPGGPAPILN